MKYVLIFILLSVLIKINAQCQYSVIDIDNSTQKVYLQTTPITLDIIQTPFSGRIILASLIRSGNMYFIEIEITTDSSAQDLEPMCFNKGARVSFSLKDNTILSLTQRTDKICGIKSYDEKINYTSVSNYARFILTQYAFETLLQSEVVLMKISDTNYNKTIVLKDELEEIIDNEVIITEPGRFFMDNIQCLIQPKFN